MGTAITMPARSSARRPGRSARLSLDTSICPDFSCAPSGVPGGRQFLGNCPMGSHSKVSEDSQDWEFCACGVPGAVRARETCQQSRELAGSSQGTAVQSLASAALPTPCAFPRGHIRADPGLPEAPENCPLPAPGTHTAPH